MVALLTAIIVKFLVVRRKQKQPNPFCLKKSKWHNPKLVNLALEYKMKKALVRTYELDQ